MTLCIRNIGKGKIVATAEGCQGFKSREQYVIEACGGRWVHRHRGYVLPESKAATLERLCREGWDGTLGIAGPSRLLEPGQRGQENGITYAQAKKLLGA